LAQAVKHLLCKHEYLSSNTSSTGKTKHSTSKNPNLNMSANRHYIVSHTASTEGIQYKQQNTSDSSSNSFTLLQKHKSRGWQTSFVHGCQKVPQPAIPVPSLMWHEVTAQRLTYSCAQQGKDEVVFATSAPVTWKINFLRVASQVLILPQ
jgi:hypothetical protein